MTALTISMFMGTTIKGGFLSYRQSVTFNEKSDQFEVNGGLLCIQIVESVVLDASEIVYEEALIEPDGEGPFQYREDEGYDDKYLQYDIYFLTFRVFLNFVSAILYCPDYFEYFLGTFDESLVSQLKDP